MRRIIFVICTFMVMCMGSGEPADASAHAAHVFARATFLAKDSGNHAPWDGRYGEKHSSFCIETFNGTNGDIREWGHGMPPGFYILVCENGQFYVNDGIPFRHLHSF